MDTNLRVPLPVKDDQILVVDLKTSVGVGEENVKGLLVIQRQPIPLTGVGALTQPFALNTPNISGDN